MIRRRILATLLVVVLPRVLHAFEIQGHEVGKTTLEEFRSRHHRVVTKDETAPFCSDTALASRQRFNPTASFSPKELEDARRSGALAVIEKTFAGLKEPHDISTLRFEAWMAAAGIVACSTTFPSEQEGEPTLAGAPTTLYTFHFVDGVLYEIAVSLRQDDFAQVRDALLAKFGQPARRELANVQNRMGATFSSEQVEWRSGAAEMLLVERAGSIDHTYLTVSDRALRARALSRRGVQGAGDL